MSEEDPGFDRPDRAVRGTEVDDLIGTEAEWDAIALARAITELRSAVEAKEQALAGFRDIESDDSDLSTSDLIGTIREYDETKADMNEAIAEAAANLVDAWAAAQPTDLIDEAAERGENTP